MLNKYELLPKEKIAHPLEEGKFLWARRIRALYDIPRHGVKQYDIGGYLVCGPTRMSSSAYWLSQYGSSWVGGDAVVYQAYVKDDALVTDNASVFGATTLVERDALLIISRSVRIYDNAKVCLTKRPSEPVFFGGAAHIYGDSKILNPTSMMFDFHLSGYSFLNGPNIYIKDGSSVRDSRIDAGSHIGRDSVVTGVILREKTRIPDGVMIFEDHDGTRKQESIQSIMDTQKVLDESVYDEQGRAIYDEYDDIWETIDEEVHHYAQDILRSSASPSLLKKMNSYHALEPLRETPVGIIEDDTVAPKIQAGITSNVNEETIDHEDLLKEIQAKVESYQSDIVKVLKYPVMVDFTDDYTRAMMESLNKTSRMKPHKKPEEFILAVDDLESKFMAAESNALRIAKTNLSDAQIKKVDTAQQLLAVAANEGSTIHERATAFKQGFKSLEGVIGVPEKTIERFKETTGLLEIEAQKRICHTIE